MSNISTHKGYLGTDFAIGCINFITSSFIIFTYVAWKAGRKAPGDIILGLAISSFLLSIYWITIPVYYLVQSTPPEPTSSFCQGFAFIGQLGFAGQFVYNFAYCLALRQAISNVIKVNARYKLVTHFICFCFGMFTPVYLLLTNKLYANNYGLCTSNLNQAQIFVEIILQFVYIISALYTIWYFYQNIPNDENLKQYKSKLLVRYVVYIMSTVIMLLFMAISNIVSELVKQSQSNDASMEIYSMIANIASTAGPCILCFVRLKNPQINRKLRNLIQATFLKEEKVEIEIPIKELQSSADPQFANLQRDIRIFQIKTILNGIVHFYVHSSEYFPDQMDLQQYCVQDRQISEIISLDEQLLHDQLDETDREIYYTLKKYKLNNAALNKEFSFHISTKAGEALEEKLAKKNLTLYPKMYALAPRFFNLLMNFDQIKFDAADSFCTIKNAKQIENMVGPDGGKSGEFFFFTYDNKWILKTLSETELNAFRERFPEYIHHMEMNRDSLINKIYGIFSIDMNQMQTQLHNENSVYHMVLMRNLSQIPRSFIKRIFDLKGSEVAREVLKGKGQSNVDLTKITLKDKDFENTEQRIFLTETQLIEIKEQLKKDVQFFRNAELMDYSLLVMKVDWGEYLQENQSLSLDAIKSNFTKFQFLPVCGDAEIHYYHFSIIDYFQEWNLKKQTEKTTKQIIAMNPHLDTSAQNPDVYAERFIQNVIEKIFQQKRED